MKASTTVNGERLRKEIAVITAIGAVPEKFLASREARQVRQRAAITTPMPGTTAATDVDQLHALARYVRESIMPYMDEAQSVLLTQLKGFGPRPDDAQVGEALQLLEALRLFDPGRPQLAEAADLLGRIVHGRLTPRDSAGGSSPRCNGEAR